MLHFSSHSHKLSHGYSMNTKLLRLQAPKLIYSGLTIVAASLTLNLLNAVAPVELLNLPTLGAANRALAQDIEEDVNVRVYQSASPAVVSIEAGDGSGSGIIIDSDGLILTNAHVVSGFDAVKVILPDGTKLDGEVIAFGESDVDLAAIRVQGQRNLPTIPIAAPGSAAVGQRAFAIGNPFGQFQGTFTTGIVSRIDTERGLIQTDTAINPGNSGGPLLNAQGELIGVNSAIFAPRGAGGNIGIGFAIAIDEVQPFLVSVRDGTAARTAQQTSPLLGGQQAERIAPNSPVEGQLTTDSGVHPADRSYFNAYTFEGKAGQQIEIDMTSSEVDSYLILLTPDGQDLAHDDDGGGGSDARLITALPADGVYTVLANSYRAGETGHYNIRLGLNSSRLER